MTRQTNFIEEDWERALQMEQMYIIEREMEELEKINYEEKSIGKITIKYPKNDKRRKRNKTERVVKRSGRIRSEKH